MLCSEANFTWKKEREGGMGEKKKGRKERNNNQAMSNICVALKNFFWPLCAARRIWFPDQEPNLHPLQWKQS